jgi:hypothetical protein
MRKASAFAILLFIAGTGIGATCARPTPAQAGAVVEAGCTLFSAFDASPEEQAICATAEDVVGMMADIRAERADAGPAPRGGKLGRKSNPCRIVGTVCATDEELALAITHRKAVR